MEPMRSLAVFFAASVFLMPSAAHAAFVPLAKDKGCTTAMAGSPAGHKVFSLRTDAAEVKSYLEQKVLCPSPCFDQKAKLTISDSSIDVYISGTNKCSQSASDPKAEDAVKDRRGCAKGQINPTIVVEVQGKASKTYPAKSRCDTTNLVAVVDTASKGDVEGALAALQKLSAPAEFVPLTAGSPVGSDQLLRAFTAANIPEAEARAAIAKNPLEAVNLINAINFGDKEQIEKSRIALGLNTDLSDVDKQAVLKATEESVVRPPVGTEYKPESEQTGFRDTRTALPTQCGVQGLAGNIMRAESACGRINSNPLSSVQGPYHFLCGTWQAYVRATGVGNVDCAYRNDPQMSTQVMNAMMDRFDQQYGAACASAGVSKTSCQYGIHVFGENGFQRLLSAYQANPNASAFSLCGAAISMAACSNNRSIFSNGGTVAGVFGELDRRLEGGSVIGSIAGPGSPFNVFGSTNRYTPLGGSPMSAFRPVSTGNPVSTGTTVSTGGPISTESPSISGTGTAGGSILPARTSPAAPVATIIVQPKEPLKGNPLVVSWSTVGMRLSPSCRMLIASSTTALLAQGNEGSKTIVLGSAGTYTFTLECAALSGIEIRQATSVLVK